MFVHAGLPAKKNGWVIRAQSGAPLNSHAVDGKTQSVQTLRQTFNRPA